MSKPKIKLGILKTESVADPDKNDEFFSLKKLNNYIKEVVENNVFFMFVELLKKISADYDISFDELKDHYLSYFQKNLKNSNLYCDILSLNLSHVDLEQISEKKAIMINPVKPVIKQITEPNTITMTNLNDGSANSIPASLANGTVANIIENKCYARTSSGIQCSRRKQADSEFCGCHLHTQPYGRVDHPCNIDTRSKKRGRPPAPQSNGEKSESKTPPTTETVQIEATLETIDGIEYIINNNTNNIYKTKECLDSSVSEISMDGLQLVGKKTPDNKVVWYSATDLAFVE